MKVNDYTMKVLKNFSSINNGIKFTANSNKLRTISQGRSILAEAEIPDAFPIDFAVYDLPQLLSVIGLFQDPELVFEEGSNFLTIKESGGSSSSKYVFASESLIVTPPDKEIQMPDADVSFSVDTDTLEQVRKGAGTIGAPDLAIERSGDNVMMVAKDKKNESTNTFSVSVGEYDGDENDEFSFHLQMDNLKIMKLDYYVEITHKGMVKFSNQEHNIHYYVALEASSTHNFS